MSEGLLPLRRHGDHGPEGELPSHLGGKEEGEGGGLSPPRFRWRRSATGATIGTTIYIKNLVPSTPTLSPSMQRCNTSSPRCNLYLNMVLNAIHYYPMMCGNPMMFE